jgi:hypothetical protein
MNLSNVGLMVTRIGGRVYLWGLKNSPQILTGLGVAGFVGTNVLTRKAALKEEDVIYEADSLIEDIKQDKADAVLADGLDEADQPYPDAQYNSDLAKAYFSKAFDIAKLYGPPVALGAISVACLIGGHYILKDRYTGLLVAYNGLSTVFKKYRDKTKEVLGADKEQEIRMGIHDEITLDENGKEVVTKVVDDDAPIEYTAKFGEGLSTQWNDDPGLNWFFLQSKQDYFNEKLSAYGFVFLNEVLEDLGLERTKDGQKIGWYNTFEGLDAPPQIQFGLEAANVRWSYGSRYDPILLDFNCDGPILDLID